MEKRLKRQIIGKPHRFLAVVPLGFEDTLVRELQAIGIETVAGNSATDESGKAVSPGNYRPHTVGDGKVEFTAKIAEAWKAVAYSRIANRILMHVDDFKAENFRDLEKKAGEIPWELYLSPDAEKTETHPTAVPSTSRHTAVPLTPRHTAVPPGTSVSTEQSTDSLARTGLRNDDRAKEHHLNIHVTCKHSRLYHSDAVAERLYKIIEGRFPLAEAPSPSTPSSGGQHLADSCPSAAHGSRMQSAPRNTPQHLFVTLIDDRCTLWLDLAGEELYKRGHERFVNDAPLKETIAAGMIFEAISTLRIIRHPSSITLFDLMAGSGTFSLEAAYAANGFIPGTCRDFALKHQPAFKEATWKYIVSAKGSRAPTGLRNDDKDILVTPQRAPGAQPLPANSDMQREPDVTPQREAQVCPLASVITSDISERAVDIIRHNVENSPLAQFQTSELPAPGAQPLPANRATQPAPVVTPQREALATAAHSLPSNNSTNPAINIDPQLRDFFSYTAQEIAEACSPKNFARIPTTGDKHAKASDKHATTGDKHATTGDKHATTGNKLATGDNDTQPLIVLNPPYGKRLEFDAPALYSRIGKKLTEIARGLEPFGKKLTVAILTPQDDPRPGSKYTCTTNLLRECPDLDPRQNPNAKCIATSHGGLSLNVLIANF